MIKYAISFAFLLLACSALANQTNEDFRMLCEAGRSNSEESIIGNANLTIHQRPASGLSLIFDFSTFTDPLPYKAHVEVTFGLTPADDTWTLYFIGDESTEKFSATEGTLNYGENKLLLRSKTPDNLNELTLSCEFVWSE